MKKVCISLITYNNHEQTVECLKSLQKIRHANFELEVVVIDNASREVFQYRPDERNYRYIFIRQEKNLGFAGGQNLGIKYGLENGADGILVLNNDTIQDMNFLEELVKSADSDEKYGAIVPKIYFTKGHEYHQKKYSDSELGKVIWYAGGLMDFANIIGHHRGVDEVDIGQYEKEENTDLMTGCCVLLQKKALEKTGMFDERYFLYYEDADLNERLKRKGFVIRYVPKAVIWHHNAGSTGGSGSKLQDYFMSRNRLLFGMTYAPLRTKIALIRESLKILRTGRDWQKKGVLDYYLRKLGKGSFGV